MEEEVITEVQAAVTLHAQQSERKGYTGRKSSGYPTHTRQRCQYIFHRFSSRIPRFNCASHVPTFTGRHAHLEDVVTLTRQRQKAYGDRLTGPQSGAKNSKPRRISVTSPKARHLKPLLLHFRLNRSRWRMPRGNGKSCSSA